MLKKKLKASLPLRKFPGDPEAESCGPGSIEQELDMCEQGELRGEDVLRRLDRKVTPQDPLSEDPLEVVEEMDSYDMSFAERDREGDEMSGDDHSSGLQGGDFELEHQRHIESGIPGADYDSWREWPSPPIAVPPLPEGTSSGLEEKPRWIRKSNLRRSRSRKVPKEG